jgi:hypothetical protein
MDGFSPYRQDEIIPLLARYLKPSGRLYIVGLEPIPDAVDDADDAASNMICQVRQVRDACILLAGHRCYREYPLDWIVRQVHRCRQHSSDLSLVDTARFPILYSHATIVKQLNVGRAKLPLFASQALADSMAQVLNDLDARAQKVTQAGNIRIQLGFDYVVAVEKQTVE